MSEVSIPFGKTDIRKPIVVGDNVWICKGVSICPGVVIGEGSIIGMGAVVRGKIPPCSIVIGNPAQVIGSRDSDAYYKLKANHQFYHWYDGDKKLSKRNKQLSGK